MPAQVQVRGARELRRTMRKAGQDMTQMNRAHAAVSSYVAGQAAHRGPRVTGALVGSLRGNAGRTSAVVRLGGARVPYANVIHWGWPRHNIEPQPFVTQAAAATEPTWLRMYLRAVDQILSHIRGA